MKVEVSFTMTYTIEVPESELAEYSSDLETGVVEWVLDNATPSVKYPDYSGNNSFVCIPSQPEVEWDWDTNFHIKLV